MVYTPKRCMITERLTGYGIPLPSLTAGVEMFPQMTPTTSSGTRARFMLDAASFERFLAAAWVLQCQRDRELLNSRPNLCEIKSASGGGIQRAKLVPDLSPANKTASIANLPVDKIQPVGVDIKEPELKQPELKLEQLQQTLRTVGEERVRRQRLQVNKDSARPDLHFDLRVILSKLQRTLNDYQRTFRLSVPLHTIRSVALTTSILVLATLSAWLLLEMQGHQSTQSAEASSRPSVASAGTPVPSGSPTVPRNVSQLGTTATSATLLAPPVSILQTSHLQVTDASASSAVRNLSRYEIRGLRRRARFGDSSAAFELGMAYETGRYLRQNCVEAARWVAQAAEAGNAAAEYNLGLRYRTGDGVRTNPAQSQRWLRKAARRNPNAKLALKLLASR